MVLTLAIKEFHEHLISARFALAAGLCLTLCLASVLVLHEDYGDRVVALAAARKAHAQEAGGRGSYLQLGAYGIRVDRPPTPLEILSAGISRNLPETAWVSDLFDHRFEGEFGRSPMAALFPLLDMTYIVSAVMGLMAMVFSYDAISGERELGTLRQVLCNSVSRHAVLLGKWAGGLAAILLPFGVASGLVAVVLALSTDVQVGANEWVAAAILLLAFALFISAMYALGLLVSSLAANSATSIVTLLLVWVVMALVLPNLSLPAAQLVDPIPSPQTLENEKAKVFRDETAEFHRKQALALKGGQAWEGMSTAMFDLRVTLHERRAVLETAYRIAQDHQVVVAQALARVSPVSCLVFASSTLAGTGLAEQRRLAEAVSEYQGQFADYVRRKTEANEAWHAGGLALEGLPVFAYAPEPMADRILSAGPDLVTLIVFHILFFMGSYVTFLRSELY